MEKYIHYFETEAEFNEARNNNYAEPWVSYTEEGEGVAYNKPDYTKIPFTVEVLGSGDITWELSAKTVQYSKNGGSWETMDSATTIPVVAGDEIQFKGMNASYDKTYFSSTAEHNFKGNIMSLVSGDNFLGSDTLGDMAFRQVFMENSTLISIKDLKLPATTIGKACYTALFIGCINLVYGIDELPATTINENSYSMMFSGCEKMKTCPKILPATTLAKSCYAQMFFNCPELVSAPELPAIVLSDSCYSMMFTGSEKLNYIKAMFIELTPTNATSNWLNLVASTGTFVKNAAATWTTTGGSGVPTGWTVETATA